MERVLPFTVRCRVLTCRALLNQQNQVAVCQTFWFICRVLQSFLHSQLRASLVVLLRRDVNNVRVQA